MVETDVARLVSAVANGDAGAGQQLVDAARGCSDGAELATVLDPLACAAGTSGHALETLLRIVDDRRLAETSVRRLIFDPHDVEDVVQDVLIAVSRSVGGFRSDARFTSWLGAVARNTAITFLRRKKESLDLDSLAEFSDGSRVSSMIADRSTLRVAIEALAPMYRDPLVLRDVDHLPYQEVADTLDLELNTVKSRIFRARAMLSQSIDLDGSNG